MYGSIISMSEAGVITLFSMGIVFATLWGLSIMLAGFKVVFKPKATPAAVAPAAVAPAAAYKPAVEDDSALIAVFIAAITEYERTNNANPSARLMAGRYKNTPHRPATSTIARGNR